MKQLGVYWYMPIAAGAFGSGHPTTDLPTFASYAAWYRGWLQLPDFTQQWSQPQFLGQAQVETGPSLLFAPGDGDQAEPFSAYKYSVQPTGGDATPYAPCPSFRLDLPNANYAIGSIRIIHDATGGKAASSPLTNPQALAEHVFPLLVLGYHFEGSTLHTSLKVGAQCYIAILTNGYNHGYQGAAPSTPYQPGVIDFAFPFAGFEGQHQVITFNSLGGVDFTTPAFQLTVPTS